MKRHSIVTKMFIITFLSFFGLITIIVLAQKLYFESYYHDQKIESLVESVDEFSDIITSEDLSFEETYRLMQSFNDNNNAQIRINDGDSAVVAAIPTMPTMPIVETVKVTEINQYDNYSFTVTDDEGAYYGFFLDKDIYTAISKDHEALDGKGIYVEGAVNKKTDTLIPSMIEIDGQQYLTGYGDKALNGDYTPFEGSVEIVQVEKISMVPMTLVEADQPVEETETVEIVEASKIPVSSTKIVKVPATEKIHLEDDLYYTVYPIPFTDIEEITFYKTITMEDGQERVLTVSASLKSISDLSDVVDRYSVYFYILAMLISLLVAGIYAKLISKPIVTLNKAASKMVEMDFDIHTEDERSDELGQLSDTLQLLSEKLSRTLSELEDSNEKLRQDIDQKEKQEQIRKDFVANVSHELKTPLGVIKSYTEGIKDGIKPDKQDYYLDVILDEVEKLDLLVMDMLELSKIESKAMILDKEVFEVRKLLDRSIETMALQLENKEMTVAVQGVFGEVIVDKKYMAMVILNLISNAVKYGDAKSEIIIRGERASGKNIITIRNKCEQLTEEELEQLWDRFYKVETSHNREKGGTGLGLAIVKGILELHESEYGARNTEDGIEFFFTCDIDKSDNHQNIVTEA